MTGKIVSATRLRFRRAVPDDVSEIVTLVNNCYRGDTSRQGWTTEADLLGGTRTDKSEIESLIAAPGSTILLCIADESIIGSVHLQQEQSSCYLGMFVVKPDLQGAGIGRKLIEAAEAYARDELRSARMTMQVITLRPELLAYYERRGYRRTGEIKPFRFDESHGIPKVEGIELEILEKDLQ
jgi:ribosomal protein S18 acetylase RimI-like enzyme